MRKLMQGLGGIALALVLVGAGCNSGFGGVDNTATPTDTSSSLPNLNLDASSTGDMTKPEVKEGEETKEPTAKDNNEGEANMSADLKNATLTLTAEASGNREVKFTWETDAKLNDSNRFIIVRSDKENPSHSGTNQWSRYAYTVRSSALGNQSLGTFHYRVCITEKNNPDVCTKYSDDVVVEVK